MQTIRKLAVRSLNSAIRAYLQHVPLAKGKSRVWDVAKFAYRRWPGLFDPCWTRTVHGHQIRVRFNEYGERMVYFWGRLAPDMEWVLEQRLRPGDVFIDVGANVGYLTLLAAKLVGESGRVIAFEPSPTTRAICERHVNLNGYRNVEIHPFAASDRGGEVTFHQPEVGCDLASMRASSCNEHRTGRSYRVQTVRLDETIPPSLNPRVRLVKVDAEGADYLVLRGMEAILKAPSPPDVICEVNDAFLREMGASAGELLKYMSALGYRALRFEGRRFRPLTATPGEWFDVFFTRSPEPPGDA